MVQSWSTLWDTFCTDVHYVPNLDEFKIPHPMERTQPSKRPAALVDDGVRDIQVAHFRNIL